MAAGAPGGSTWFFWWSPGQQGRLWAGPLPTVCLVAAGLGRLACVTPPGRMLLAAAGARVLLRRVGPGDHPRGGNVHLRLWLAERVVDELGATGLAGAPYMTWFARLLGAQVGRDVDLHSHPAGDRAAAARRRLLGRARGRPQRLLGRRRRGAPRPVRSARERAIGARSMLCPGADVGQRRRGRRRVGGLRHRPGRRVLVRVHRRNASRSGPAARGRTGRAPPRVDACLRRHGGAARPAALRSRSACAALPVLPRGRPPGRRTATCSACSPGCLSRSSSACSCWRCSSWRGAGAAPWVCGRACTRSAAARRWRCGPRSGCSTTPAPGCSRSTPRACTPAWLRLLGARIGTDVEASTVLMIPSLTQVNDQSFLADDTLIGGYELGGGWLRVERVKIGKRAFVGNSGHGRARAARSRRRRWSPCCRPRRGARPRTPARPGSAARPPRCAVRPRPATPAAPTHPPTRLKVARALVELCRARPVVLVARRLRRGRGCSAWLLARARRTLACLVALRPRRCSPSAAWSRRWSRPPRSGCWSAGSGRRAPAVELVRVAQRAGRHLRRGGGRAVVRPGGRRHAAAQRLVPADGREDRPRGVVRDLLAARDRPGRARRRRHRQPGHRRADPPVPRPDADHGPGRPQARRHPRPEQRHPPCGHARAARYGRSRVAGHEG